MVLYLLLVGSAFLVLTYAQRMWDYLLCITQETQTSERVCGILTRRAPSMSCHSCALQVCLIFYFVNWAAIVMLSPYNFRHFAFYLKHGMHKYESGSLFGNTDGIYVVFASNVRREANETWYSPFNCLSLEELIFVCWGIEWHAFWHEGTDTVMDRLLHGFPRFHTPAPSASLLFLSLLSEGKSSPYGPQTHTTLVHQSFRTPSQSVCSRESARHT